MRIQYAECKPNQHTPPKSVLIKFVESHGFTAREHGKDHLAVSDGFVSALIPASVRAVKFWLGY